MTDAKQTEVNEITCILTGKEQSKKLTSVINRGKKLSIEFKDILEHNLNNAQVIEFLETKALQKELLTNLGFMLYYKELRHNGTVHVLDGSADRDKIGAYRAKYGIPTDVKCRSQPTVEHQTLINLVRGLKKVYGLNKTTAPKNKTTTDEVVDENKTIASITLADIELFFASLDENDFKDAIKRLKSKEGVSVKAFARPQYK